MLSQICTLICQDSTCLELSLFAVLLLNHEQLCISMTVCLLAHALQHFGFLCCSQLCFMVFTCTDVCE